jgi:DNA-binding MarR family transcriptional regulator
MPAARVLSPGPAHAACAKQGCPGATLFRQLTRAVFAAQSSVLHYGDRANAAFGQSSARWRVMFNIAQGIGTVAEIARETDYARQSVQRLADVLVADGLATYAPDPADRRSARRHRRHCADGYHRP